VGAVDHPQARALLAVVNGAFRPTTVVAAHAAGAADPAIPLLAVRELPAGTGTAAWVCRRSTCAAPTSDPEELRVLLDHRTP
jgi:uncharacterized protein YyaL (SSP411 family)